MNITQRIFGRTQRQVPFIWTPRGDFLIGDDQFIGLQIGPDALEKRRDQVVKDKLADIGRKKCELLILHDLTSSDLKVGWPMHRMLQLREKGLCDWFAIEVECALEAEWIAANAPIHAIIAPYSIDQMQIRYRVFEVAHNAGIAIVCHAQTLDDLRLHIATPQICASIVDPVMDIPDAIKALDDEELWQEYQLTHTAPEKLRSGHPPETGV